MQDKTPARFNWSAVMDCAVGSLARVQIELLQKSPKADARSLVPDADSNGAIFVMNAHGDHGALEARVRHSGHRQKQLAGQEGRFISHSPTMSRSRALDKA